MSSPIADLKDSLKNVKGTPPSNVRLSRNITKPDDKESKVHFGIQVSPEIKLDFQIEAKKQGYKSVGEFFAVVWSDYKKRH